MKVQKKQKKVCVVDAKEIKRNEKCYEVKEDAIIRAIRKAKQLFNDAVKIFKKDFNIMKNYKLCVCKKHVVEYAEKRKRFERSMILYASFAGLLIMFFSAMPLIVSGTIKFSSILSSLVLGAIIILFGLFGYVAKVDISEEELKKLKESDKDG